MMGAVGMGGKPNTAVIELGGKKIRITDWDMTACANYMDAITWEEAPIPEWNYTDKRGHLHKWTKRGKEFYCRTVKILKETHWTQDDGYPPKSYQVDITVCRKCGEEIKLGMRSFEESGHVPTTREYRGFFVLSIKNSTKIQCGVQATIMPVRQNRTYKIILTQWAIQDKELTVHFIGTGSPRKNL